MLFVFSKFKKHKWVRLNTQKRLKVYQALENKFAKKQRRDPLPVLIYPDSNWECLGMFTLRGGEKRIYLHESLLIDTKMRFHGMETILHEGRHAYQYMTVSKKLPWYAFRAKRWQKNWLGYVPSGENTTVYNNQAVERDAQKYAFNQMLNVAHKYDGDPDFAQTMKINQYRLEYADDEARKKYGIFYKHKINKIINSKAENNWD